VRSGLLKDGGGWQWRLVIRGIGSVDIFFVVGPTVSVGIPIRSVDSWRAIGIHVVLDLPSVWQSVIISIRIPGFGTVSELAKIGQAVAISIVIGITHTLSAFPIVSHVVAIVIVDVYCGRADRVACSVCDVAHSQCVDRIGWNGSHG